MSGPAQPDVAMIETAIVEMTNTFRRRNNLGAVTPEAKLVNAARAYAAYLARTGKFAHDADGRQPSERVATAGYQYCYIAENLAVQPLAEGAGARDVARETVEGWINSKRHREGMLAPYATDTAVAVVRTADAVPRWVAVQLMGRPRALAYRFQVSNTTGDTVRYSFGDKVHELVPGNAFTHTTCLPSEVAFEGAPAPHSRYQTRDGQLFVLERSGSGFRVDVRQQERID